MYFLYYNSNIVELLKKEQQRRIVPKFDDEENKEIDTHIKELVLIMTSKVRQCEDNIKKLKSISFNSKIDTIVLNLDNNIKELKFNYSENVKN